MWGIPHHTWLLLALAVILLALCTACATRKLESCMASFVMIGPGLLTLDCRPPAALDNDDH